MPTATAPLIADYLYDPTGNKGAVARTRSYSDPDVSNTTVASALTSTSTATAFDTRGRLTGYTVQINGSSNSNDANHNLPATVDTSDTSVTAQSDGVRRWVSAVSNDDIGRETVRNLRGIGTVGIDNTVAYQPADGRTSTITSTINGGGNNGRRIQQDTYSYDAPGNPTRIVHDPDVLANYAGQPSTANELAGLDQSECHYYDARQPLTRSYTPAGATACLAAPGTTVPLGGPTPYTETNSYDGQTRLTTKESRAYSYVNLTGQNAPVDPTGCAAGTQTRPHAVRAITGGTPSVEWFGYDCNGWMISRRADPGAGQQVVDTYGWDVRNRLQTVKRGPDTSTNIYDTTGQRILRREPDGRRVIYLGALEIRHQPGQDLRAVKHPAAGITIDFDQTRSYTTHNHQASITDNTTPTATAPTRYRPYGAVRDGNPIAGRSFLNEYDDPDHGLNYLNNRHYNTATGVFISIDPIAHPGTPASLNPYMHARGTPITLSDPTGLEPGCGLTAYSRTSCREAHTAASQQVPSSDARDDGAQTSSCDASACSKSLEFAFNEFGYGGTVTTNVFIQARKVGGWMAPSRGDNRVFSEEPLGSCVRSRLCLSLDLTNGRGALTVNYSCRPDGTCFDAWDIGGENNSINIETSYREFQQDGRTWSETVLSVSVEGMHADSSISQDLNPLAINVSESFTLTTSVGSGLAGPSIQATYVVDSFPSYEIFTQGVSIGQQ